MTGFGRGYSSSLNKKITVDVKSLNSKQLDLMVRVPNQFREIELDARNLVASKLERGKVELNAVCETIGVETSVHLNFATLAAYKAQVEELARQLSLPMPQDWYATLLRLPDALKSEAMELDEDDTKAFYEAVGNALDALVEFRKTEGRKLYSFFITKIENISTLLGEVDKFENDRVPKIKQRLEEQLEKLSSIEYDKGRLEQELIFYIEKLDVTEEKTRLRAHLAYFIETLGGTDDTPAQGQGKKLGFIAQEMGREINTLGSKSNQADMQKLVVMMKDELEQIKEQVLNVL